MTRFRRIAVAASTVACASFAYGATAIAAPKTTVTCGQVITTSIKVANDLTNCPGDGLVVGAPGITIDLNNRTIDGSGSGEGIDNTSGHAGVTVKRGTVKEFNAAVVFDHGADDGKIDHVNALNSRFGIHVLNSARVEVAHGSGSGNASHGLLAGGAPDLVVHHGAYHRNGFAGATLFGDNNRAVVRHVDANENGEFGVGVQADSHDVVVDHVRAKRNGGGPLSICECGIYVDHNVTNLRITHSDTDDNGWFGIGLFSANAALLEDNHADRNGIDGIFVDRGGSTLTGNHVGKNVNLGINAAAGTIDGGRNKAHKNGNPAQCTGVSC